MATSFQWVQMILKNHAGVIALWVAIVGITGYTAYRDVPRETIPEPQGEVEKPVERPSVPCVCDTSKLESKLDAHIKEYKGHSARFH
jgi:hypothetical protein